MASNPYVNKVQKADGTTLIDLTSDTAVASDVASGKYFHLATGERVAGTASSAGGVVITDTTDTHGGTIRTITGTLISGTKSITSNGTGIDVTSYAAVDVAVPQLDTSDANATASDIRSGKSGYVNGSKVNGSLTSRDSTSLSANGDTVTVPAGIYDTQATKSVSSMTLPTATSSTASGTNKATIAAQTGSARYINIPTGYNSSAACYTISAVVSGTAGTPTATKGTVSNHSVSVTPSVTNTTGYITGSTKTGTAVTVSASELVSGSETKTANGTYDVTNLASLVVNVSGGSSKNVQCNQSTSRTTSTSLTSLNSFTCSTAGTYDVYWSCVRSSTNGTWSSQLYIGGTATGDAQATWSNHVQNVHLTNITIAKNQTVAVYARSRGSNYYAYVPQVTIVQTS